MANTVSKLISRERAERILKCYGSSPVAWPAEESSALKSLLEHDDELQNLARQQARLDTALHADCSTATHTEALAERILAALPEQQTANISQRPGNSAARQAPWYFALAATLLLAAGSLQLLMPSDTHPHRAPDNLSAENDAVEQWMWEDINGFTSSQDPDAELLPLYALVEADLDGEEQDL